MKILLVIIVVLGCFFMATSAQTPSIEPGVSQELAKWRAAHYSDVRYKIALTLEKMSPVLKGTIEIRVKIGAATLLSPSPPSGEKVPIILDWRKLRGHEEKSTVSNVTVNGVPADFSRLSPRGDRSVAAPNEEINEHLIFREGVVAGENVIKLDFTSPILTSGSAVTRYVDKEDGSEYLYSLFVPSDASTAFPVFDQPDLKARFELDVVLPKGWNVVSNTGIQRVTKRWCDVEKPCFDAAGFGATKPISTYVFAFAAGPWEKFDHTGGNPSDSEGVNASHRRDTLPIGRVSASRGDGSIFVRKSQFAKFKPDAAEVFRLNREAVKYFEEYFDYKFPFPKYDLVLIPEFPFGGMEHAGATFLRESSIIFPQEPTKNDLVSRATLIFHETAHQWFGDTVTMRWFDDLWLKEGFATFMGYKAMEKIMPETNAWKVFYERIKQGAYQTDSTKGTTPIYQEIKNLSAAKSAYGNIVYNKAPAFLRQAEFYLGEDKFQTAVRSFLKKHEYANAGWEDLVKEFELASGRNLREWAASWVQTPGVPTYHSELKNEESSKKNGYFYGIAQEPPPNLKQIWPARSKVILQTISDGPRDNRIQVTIDFDSSNKGFWGNGLVCDHCRSYRAEFMFPNYGDYGYGIFLLDDKSRDYVLKNVQNEKDPFLRSMMWGALWDSVRESELDPREYVELVVKVLSKSDAFTRSTPGTAKAVTPTDDESTVALLLNRVGTAMNYYLSVPEAVATGAVPSQTKTPVVTAPGTDKSLQSRLENMLIERMQNAPTLGQRITYYRAFLNVASSENARNVLKKMLKSEPPASAGGQSGSTAGKGISPNWPADHAECSDLPLKNKDKFDIVTRLLILNDPEAPKLLADLEKTETSDDAKRYAYAAKAGIATAEYKAKYWNDFTNNKEISESWIEAAFGPWNSIRHSELTLPYLEKALQELPNHKRNRKIFFVNGWLGAFIGGQRSEEALNIVNKFLVDNPNLDRDLRLKILENVDLIERAVKIRSKYKS